MNLKVILAVVFAFLVGIGGTSAYFYFDRLNNAWNAPPVPPAKTESAPPPIEPSTAGNPKEPAPKGPVAPAVATNGTLTEADLAIGGISVGASINDVRTAHGEPYKIENKHKWHGRTQATVYEYPSLFDLYVVDGIVHAIKLDRLNGLRTSKNIGIGSTFEDIVKAYGEPNLKDKDHAVYFVKDNPSMGIDFEIEHGLVEEIRAGLLK